jgi:hypothetical protein
MPATANRPRGVGLQASSRMVTNARHRLQQADRPLFIHHGFHGAYHGARPAKLDSPITQLPDVQAAGSIVHLDLVNLEYCHNAKQEAVASYRLMRLSRHVINPSCA